MVGISVEQWRYSIGLFNIKSVRKRFRKVVENLNPIQQSFNLICHFLGSMPVKILFGLCKVFVYCSMIISFLPLLLFLYPFFHLFSYQCPFVNYFVYFFFKITLLRWCISTPFRSIYSFFKSQSSEKVKNIMFFIFAIQILLIISGSVEINPGPHIPNVLSFAVWNLDSPPASDSPYWILSSHLWYINYLWRVWKLYLDSRLNFSKHIKEQVLKAMKGVSLLKFLSKYVNWNVLYTFYKMYVRLHLDYGDVILHNQRMDLMNLIERAQHKASLIVSGCWQGASRGAWLGIFVRQEMGLPFDNIL